MRLPPKRLRLDSKDAFGVRGDANYELMNTGSRGDK